MTTSNIRSAERSRSSWMRLAALTTLVLLGSTRATFAGFISPNAGSVAGITYAVDNVNAAGGPIRR